MELIGYIALVFLAAGGPAAATLASQGDAPPWFRAVMVVVAGFGCAYALILAARYMLADGWELAGLVTMAWLIGSTSTAVMALIDAIGLPHWPYRPERR